MAPFRVSFRKNAPLFLAAHFGKVQTLQNPEEGSPGLFHDLEAWIFIEKQDWRKGGRQADAVFSCTNFCKGEM